MSEKYWIIFRDSSGVWQIESKIGPLDTIKDANNELDAIENHQVGGEHFGILKSDIVKEE